VRRAPALVAARREGAELFRPDERIAADPRLVDFLVATFAGADFRLLDAADEDLAVAFFWRPVVAEDFRDVPLVARAGNGLDTVRSAGPAGRAAEGAPVGVPAALVVAAALS